MALSKSVIILISVYVWLYHMVMYLKKKVILDTHYSQCHIFRKWNVDILNCFDLLRNEGQIWRNLYQYHLFRKRRRHNSDTSIYIFKSFILLQNISQSMYEGICHNQAILLGNLMEVSMHEFQCIFIPLLLCNIS